MTKELEKFGMVCLKCFKENSDYLNVKVEIVYDVEEGRDTSIELLHCKCNNCDEEETGTI